MSDYRGPGVYIEEIPSPPPSVEPVETAIPAFIGFTEKGPTEPTRLGSMSEYRQSFGGPDNDIGRFTVVDDESIESPGIPSTPRYRLYYHLEMFFANGGGDCYIVSAGNYDGAIDNRRLEDALNRLADEDEPTLILFPDAYEDPYDLYKKALAQCADLKNRFLICDVKQQEDEADPIRSSAEEFRKGIGSDNLMFGAAYYPDLETTLSHRYEEDEIGVVVKGNREIQILRHSEETIQADDEKAKESLYHAEGGDYQSAYKQIKAEIASVRLTLPSGGAIAGVYARVDRSTGVWKAPANVSLNRVSAPEVQIGDKEQGDLNAPPSGKSINAIRSFTGKGVLVWGARTLAGNDNEWRYIPVRRLVSMVEASITNALGRLAHEPNNAETWETVKAMVQNFLTRLWESGALRGTTADEAFYVKVGLGETMSAEQILEGRLIVEIGMAALRPAEFIVSRISQEMREI